MTTEEIKKTEEFIQFVKSARAFCTFIETGNSVSFLQLTQTHLQNLYFDAKKLQSVDLTLDSDFPNKLNDQEEEEVLNLISDKLGKNRYYWHVFDPTKDEDMEPVCGDLLDDLGDIYMDIKNSLLSLDSNVPAEVESAIWNFRFDFETHWGDHCIIAIYALHYFIQKTQ